jgi:hypothetical protein
MSENLKCKLVTFFGVTVVLLFVFYRFSIKLNEISSILYFYLIVVFYLLREICKYYNCLKKAVIIWGVFWIALFLSLFENDLNINSTFVVLFQLLIIPLFFSIKKSI